MKTTSVHWFSNSKGTIGIITRIDEHTDERKLYISSVSGINEAVDIRMIEEWGGTISPGLVKTLYDFIYDEDGKLR